MNRKTELQYEEEIRQLKLQLRDLRRKLKKSEHEKGSLKSLLVLKFLTILFIKSAYNNFLQNFKL